MERELDSEKIIQTSRELRDWITKEFEEAHLGKIAEEVHQFAKQAVRKAERIRRPCWTMRFFTFLLVLALAGVTAHQIMNHTLEDIVLFLRHMAPAAATVIGVVILVLTLETRWKRHRARKAISEIRAVAHIVDMHQLAKDEALENFRDDHKHAKIVEYLHACTALLALLAKVAELYVEQFPDPVATAAVDDFQHMVGGLRTNIWLKIVSMGVNRKEEQSEVDAEQERLLGGIENQLRLLERDMEAMLDRSAMLKEQQDDEDAQAAPAASDAELYRRAFKGRLPEEVRRG